ncbi:hypothetical protein SLS60_008497 [Paraconiothyrium brasiliense]|uniref:Uncharacterized protein n=1 Tax=Paraconiothyrium brasiliense TaxID=300254 RepID=A0ABR3R0Q6_9PLEO
MESQSDAPQAWADSRQRVGFVVYRTDYRDDAQWARFMAFLNNQAHTGLIDDGKGDIIKYLDWRVQVCPPTSHQQTISLTETQSTPDLQGANEIEVRKRFNDWLQSGEEDPDDSYRYRACVLVDDVSLDAVDEWMEGKSLDDDDPLTLFDRRGRVSVWLVSRHEEEGEFEVGLSYLFPTVAFLIQMEGEGQGWDAVAVPLGETATPW